MMGVHKKGEERKSELHKVSTVQYWVKIVGIDINTGKKFDFERR